MRTMLHDGLAVRTGTSIPMLFHSTEWDVEIMNTGKILANSTVDARGASSKATDLRFDREHP